MTLTKSLEISNSAVDNKEIYRYILLEGLNIKMIMHYSLNFYAQFYLLGLFLLLFYPISYAQPLRVVTTNSVFKDMVQVLGGNMVECESLIPSKGSPTDSISLNQNAALLEQADILFIHGLVYETWLEATLEEAAVEGIKIDLSKNIAPLKNLTDPRELVSYAWLDARNGMVYARNIKDALVQQDPQNARNYLFNYQFYIHQLIEVDSFIQETVQEIPEEQRYLPTALDAFRYFGSRYGLTFRSGPQKTDKGIQDTLYIDSLGPSNGPASTYLDMLRHNTLTLSKGLKQTQWPITEDQPLLEKTTTWTWGVVGFFMMLILGILYLKRQKKAKL